MFNNSFDSLYKENIEFEANFETSEIFTPTKSKPENTQNKVNLKFYCTLQNLISSTF